MDYHAGLDVSLEETSVCVVDGDGAVAHEAKVATEVEAIAETLRRLARSLARVGLEAGPLSPWLHGGLHGAGFPVVCIETRHLNRRHCHVNRIHYEIAVNRRWSPYAFSMA